MHRVLARLAAEERGQLADGTPVGEPGRDVRPLGRIGLSENMPRNSSSVGRTGTIPWAWWSTAGTAQSASSEPRPRSGRRPAQGAPTNANAGSVTLSQ